MELREEGVKVERSSETREDKCGGEDGDEEVENGGREDAPTMHCFEPPWWPC